MSGVYGDILAKVETSAGAGRGEADLWGSEEKDKYNILLYFICNWLEIVHA